MSDKAKRDTAEQKEFRRYCRDWLATNLGYRTELAAIDDPLERKRVYEEKVAQAYERGKGFIPQRCLGLMTLLIRRTPGSGFRIC